MKRKLPKKLRVLFWVAPITEMAWPLQKTPWMKLFLPRVQNAFRKIGCDIDSTIIASENLVAECDRRGIEVDGSFVGISQGDMLGAFRFNALDEMVRYQGARESSPFFDNLGVVVRKALGDAYCPNVVVSFSPSPFFRDIYPEALLLYHEYGMFSRRPYPETFYFDPYGAMSRNFTTTHAAQINAIPAPQTFLDELERYRVAIRAALCSNELLDGYFQEIRRRFRKVLLLPLSFEGFADARVNFHYQTQLEYVEHVLDTVPKDVAIILTQHAGKRAFGDEAVSSIKTLNPNLFHETWYYNVPFFSQIAIPYCDACITQNSSLGYQAIFHGKLFFSVGGFCEGIADARSVEEIPGALERKPMARDNFLVWVLRNHVADMDDLPNYLRGILTAWYGRTTLVDSPKDWPDSCSLDRFKRRIRRWTEMITPPQLNGATMRVYFDFGKGFSTEKMMAWSIAEGPQSFKVEKKIRIPEGCIAIRYDPTESYIVEVSDLHLIGEGGEIALTWHNGTIRDGVIRFKTLDPQLVFRSLGTSASVLLTASVRVVDAVNAVRALTSELSETRRRVADASKKLTESDARLQSANNLAQQMRQTIDAESAQVKMLSVAVAEAKEVASALHAARAEADRERAEVTRKLIERDDEYAKLSVRLSKVQAEANRERDEASRKLLDKVDECEKLSVALNQANTDLASARNAIRMLSDQVESRSWRKRIHRIMKGLLPYGVTCTWKRMAYGIAEDRPLFAYPGFFKRCRRIVKFLLPYFVVALFRRMRYGKSRR